MRGWSAPELTPLKTQKLLSNFSVFDIETEKWSDDITNKPDQAEYWHGRDLNPFFLTHWDGSEPHFYAGKNCVKDFVDDIIGKKKYRAPHVFYAHNGGKFDFLPVFHYLKSQKPWYHILPMMQHARIMNMRIKDRNRNVWMLRDSFSLLPHSLKRLCKGFKTPHQKMELPEVPYKGNKKLWEEYCLNDCLALYDVLSMFSDVIKEVGGSIAGSAAGTAMRTWRLSYLKRCIPTYHDFNKMFRNAYYGGRTEIFNQYARAEDGPFYDYDVNSMYPSVMKDYLYPVSYPVRVDWDDPSEVRGRLGIMECRVAAPADLDIPLLPFHAEKKLLFPIGTWTGFYDFCEIDKALSLGYDIEPLRTWEFEGDYIFKDFVDTFYPMKQANKGNAKGEIAKLLQNSLYGKTGEHDEQPKLIEEGDYLGLAPTDLIYGYATKTEVRRSPYHLPAIALRVTALARIRLYEYFEKIRALGGTIYYCDTDSIITDVRMPTGNELGGIKMVKDFSRGVFLQPKMYLFDPFEYQYDDEKKRILDYVACKGFSRQFKERLTFELFEEALLTQDFSKLSEKTVRPASFKESFIRKQYGFTTIVQERSVQNTYDKRNVNPDYSTTPIKMLDGVSLYIPHQYDEEYTYQDEDES